ncbi:UNVERIFIED_CONTAM: Galectin-7 [Trichonephila clavipes]
MYHFNPRFPENSIVCNNRCAESWGDEQALEGSPIVPGDRVTVVIVAAREGFIPFINGNPLPSFAHRLDICAACTIVIDGDIRLENVTFDSPPVRLPPHIPDIDIDAFDDKTVQTIRAIKTIEIYIKQWCSDRDERDKLVSSAGLSIGRLGPIEFLFKLKLFESTPVTMNLPCCFGPGKGVYVSGKVSDSPSRFLIPRQVGKSLHLAPCPFFLDASFLTAFKDLLQLNLNFMVTHPGQEAAASSAAFKAVGLNLIFILYSRFEINLQCGEADSDIALHFNPRFDPSSELVLNSRDDGSWGEEIRESNPIAPGSEVEVYILCQDSGYVVVIDGDVVIGSFPHRIDSSRVTHVNIDGNITVHRILGM